MEWDDYFFLIADAVAKKSPCLSKQKGAIVVRGKYIVAMGYNGPPSGYPHCSGNECPRHKLGYASGHGLELCPAAHAERNALIEAARIGVSTDGCVLYTTRPYPCRECAKEIVNAGIKEVVITDDTQYPEEGLTGRKILEVCGVKVRIGREVIS